MIFSPQKPCSTSDPTPNDMYIYEPSSSASTKTSASEDTSYPLLSPPSPVTPSSRRGAAMDDDGGGGGGEVEMETEGERGEAETLASNKPSSSISTKAGGKSPDPRKTSSKVLRQKGKG